MSMMRRAVVGSMMLAGLLSGCGDTVTPAGGGADVPPVEDAPGADTPRVEDAPVADVARDAGVDRADPPDTAPSCAPGQSCGNDCLPSDAPCWACGTLTFNARCECVAQSSSCAPATGCDNPAPAGVGEFCGAYRWCRRACAAGLACTGHVPGGHAGDYRTVCEPAADAGPGDAGPVDAGTADAASFQAPSGDAGSFACGASTCGAGQVCVLDCSGVDAGGRDLHRCAPLPAGCGGAARCACGSVCFTGACTQGASGVVECLLCA